MPFLILYIFSKSPSRLCAWRHCLTLHHPALPPGQLEQIQSFRPISVQCPPLEPPILQFRLPGHTLLILCPCLRFLNHDGLVNCLSTLLYKRAFQSRPLHLSSPMLHQFHQFHQCYIWLNGSLEDLHPNFPP